MVRSRFDAQLEQLNVELIKMGALCEEAITASVSALMKYDRTVVQMVFEKDNEIDHMERDIETFCMRLLLQQQPVARDLRTISSALKMISDMERIGDQAGDIAQAAYSGNGTRNGKDGNGCSGILCEKGLDTGAFCYAV